jgi:cell volume regulation protein A
MFIALGLLVNIDELRDPNVLIIGGLVGVFMIFVARPATVLLCMAPFRKFTTKARAYVSWVGLRGAVPIIFATYPLVADVPGARFMFNVVYLVTILSLIIQGTTVSSMANVLGLAEEEEEASFEVEMPDKIKSAMTEIRINASMIARGNQLKQIALPDHTLVVMARRGERYFIPKGHTTLEEGDRLLIISDNDEELQRELAALGITKVVKLR